MNPTNATVDVPMTMQAMVSLSGLWPRILFIILFMASLPSLIYLNDNIVKYICQAYLPPIPKLVLAGNWTKGSAARTGTVRESCVDRRPRTGQQKTQPKLGKLLVTSWWMLGLVVVVQMLTDANCGTWCKLTALVAPIARLSTV